MLFPRKRESDYFNEFWSPTFAGRQLLLVLKLALRFEFYTKLQQKDIYTIARLLTEGEGCDDQLGYPVASIPSTRRRTSEDFVLEGSGFKGWGLL